jgi:cation transporter-like permease
MVAQPIFMTKSAASAGAVGARTASARHGNTRLASAKPVAERHVAAAVKSFWVIIPTPMVVRRLALIVTACQSGKIADYNVPTALAKG